MASHLSLEKKIIVVSVLDDILASKEIAYEIAFFLQNQHQIQKSTKNASFDHFRDLLRER